LPLHYKYLISHSADALNAPSLAAFTEASVCVRRTHRMGHSTPEKKISRRAHQITAGSKPMVDTLKMDAAVSRSETCEFFIRRFGQRQWEQLIKLAGIDQERGLALFDVNLRCNAFSRHARMSISDAHPNPLL
jgi:hypothetical protein